MLWFNALIQQRFAKEKAAHDRRWAETERKMRADLEEKRLREQRERLERAEMSRQRGGLFLPPRPVSIAQQVDERRDGAARKNALLGGCGQREVGQGPHCL